MLAAIEENSSNVVAFFAFDKIHDVKKLIITPTEKYKAGLVTANCNIPADKNPKETSLAQNKKPLSIVYSWEARIIVCEKVTQARKLIAMNSID